MIFFGNFFDYIRTYILNIWDIQYFPDQKKWYLVFYKELNVTQRDGGHMVFIKLA